MPSQQRVWGDEFFQLGQRFSTERICLWGESPSFGVGETDAAFAQVFLEHAIFFLDIVDRVQLMAVDPSSEHHQ